MSTSRWCPSGRGKREVELYSDEYYVEQKANQHWIGLVLFFCELFKMGMLSERVMHECVRKLLWNIEDPEEEVIKSLCKLLSTVGWLMDTAKAKAHMDLYFLRIKEMHKSPNISPRMRFLLLVWRESSDLNVATHRVTRMLLNSESGRGLHVHKDQQ